MVKSGFLPCCLVQNYAGGYSCIQRLDARRMRDHDQLIHLGDELLVEAGAFVADENRYLAAEICLWKRKCLCAMKSQLA